MGTWAARGIENYGVAVTGAFYSGGKNGKKAGGDVSTGVTIGFDASRSNPIYGSSETVNPSSISCSMFIKF